MSEIYSSSSLLVGPKTRWRPVLLLLSARGQDDIFFLHAATAAAAGGQMRHQVLTFCLSCFSVTVTRRVLSELLIGDNEEMLCAFYHATHWLPSSYVLFPSNPFTSTRSSMPSLKGS